MNSSTLLSSNVGPNSLSLVINNPISFLWGGWRVCNLYSCRGPLAQKNPALGLMLICCILKFLIIFVQRAPHFNFFTRPHKSCGHSWAALSAPTFRPLAFLDSWLYFYPLTFRGLGDCEKWLFISLHLRKSTDFLLVPWTISPTSDSRMLRSFSVNAHDQYPMACDFPFWAQMALDLAKFWISPSLPWLLVLCKGHRASQTLLFIFPVLSTSSSLRVTTPFFTFWEAHFQAPKPDHSLITLTFNLIIHKYYFCLGEHIPKSIRILLGRRRHLNSYEIEVHSFWECPVLPQNVSKQDGSWKWHCFQLLRSYSIEQ